MLFNKHPIRAILTAALWISAHSYMHTAHATTPDSTMVAAHNFRAAATFFRGQTDAFSTTKNNYTIDPQPIGDNDHPYAMDFKKAQVFKSLNIVQTNIAQCPPNFKALTRSTILAAPKTLKEYGFDPEDKEKHITQISEPRIYLDNQPKVCVDKQSKTYAVYANTGVCGKYQTGTTSPYWMCAPAVVQVVVTCEPMTPGTQGDQLCT